MTKRGLCIGLAFGVACTALGCGPNISRPAPGPDCAAGDGYVFPAGFSLDASTIGLDADLHEHGYAFDDATPRGLLNGLQHIVPMQGVPGPPPGRMMDVDTALTCDHSRVLDLQSSGHNDYGSTFVWEFKDFQNSLDASGTAGIAFWARSVDAASDKSVFVQLNDRYTDVRGGICIDNSTTMMNPNNPSMPVLGSGMGSGSSVTLPYAVPAATDCSNFYQRIVQFTDVWTLYLLPFDSFAQTAFPNRNPNGIDISQLWSISFQVPKEADFEIWIDQIAAYQPSSAAAGP